jgi:hypothetical protein
VNRAPDLIKLELKFEVGTEFEEKMPFGAVNKSVGCVDGETLKITSQTPKGELVRTFKLLEGGKELELVSTLNVVSITLSTVQGVPQVRLHFC